MVSLNLRGIPRKVLTGKSPKFRKVFNLYRARFLQEFFRHLNESYWTRAEGSSDNVAGDWEPLARSTIQIKEKKSREFAQLNSYQGKVGLLSPENQTTYNKALKAALAELPHDTKNRLAKAKRKAWHSIDQEREFASLINIRTGRLVAATLPGTVSNNRYYPPPEQQYTMSLGRISISLNAIEYAKEVDEGSENVPARPIIPDDITKWIIESHETIIDEVKTLYDSMLSSSPNRPKRSKKRKRSRD